MHPTKYDVPLTGLDWLEYYGKHDVYHPGVDYNKGYGQADCGQEVYAAKDGFVDFVWNSTWNSGGMGKFIILQHDDGNFTRYAHLQSVVASVRSGKRVKEGDLIGYVGNTGTLYCHLHFEVFNKKLAAIQSSHWRRWRWYPVGKSKAWVQEHYLNPWEWIKEEEKTQDGTPKWATAGVTFAKAHELIKNFEGNNISDYELALVLMRFHDKFIK